MIQGLFSDIHGVQYEVKFYVDENITINDDNDDTIKWGDEPVIISTEYDNDTRLYVKHCTIKLLTTRLITSLFTDNDREVIVTVRKANTSQYDFYGYVEPATYNQDYESTKNYLDVNCVDYLGTLSNHKYKESTGFEEGKRTASTVSLITILRNILPQGFILTPRWLYYNDGSATAKELLKKIRFSEYFAYGDDEDSWMTEEDMLAQIMLYLNMKMCTVQSAYMIFPPLMQTTVGSYNLYDLESDASITSIVTDVRNVDTTFYAADDMQITYNDLIKKQFVRCDLSTISENKIELMDSDDIVSDWVNFNTLLYTADKDGKNITHYGISICKNDKWKLRYVDNQWQSISNPQTYHVSDYTTLTEYDNNGLAINQNKVIQTICKNRLAPMMIQIGSESMSRYVDTNEMGNKDYSVRSISGDNSILIPFNGTQRDSNYGAGNSMELTTDNIVRAMLNEGGMIEYVDNTDMSILRPDNDQYPNYIVIDGSVTFLPVLQQLEGLANGQWWSDVVCDENGTILYCRDYKNHSATECANIAGTTITQWQGKGRGGVTKTIRTYDDTYPQFFDSKQELKDATAYTPIQDYDGYISSYLPTIYNTTTYEDIKFRITNYIKNVPVLVCQMKIGNKYLVELKKDSSPTSFETKYLWLTQQEAYSQYNVPSDKLTFCITISPNNDDSFFNGNYSFTSNDLDINYIGESGLAIPIKSTDNLQGQLEFKIIKPFYFTPQYATWQPAIYNNHLYTNWEYDHPGVSSLSEFIGSILIKDISISVVSGLQYQDTVGGDKDTIIHSNEANTAYEEDIDFNYASRLTWDEYTAKKINVAPAYNYPQVEDKNGILQYVRTVQDRVGNRTKYLEDMYIDDIINANSTPKKTIDVTMWLDKTHTASQMPYSKNYAFSYLGGTYHIEEESIDLKLCRNKVKLVEN